MIMDKNAFSARLAQLREQKGISARDMSISLGNGNNYINNIETQKYYPKMENFLYICEFLDISPSEFFEAENKYPNRLNSIISNMKKLDNKELEQISGLIETLVKNKK